MTTSSPETAARGRWDITKLREVINRPPGSERTLEELRDFTSSKDYIEIARGLEREEVAKLVDILDQVRRPSPRDAVSLDNDHDGQSIRYIDWRNTQHTTLLRALGSICSATIQLPHTAILSDGLEISGNIAMASGGFTDTWRGLYQGKTVAFKAFRTLPLQDLREVEKVCLASWRTFPF